MTIDPAKVKLLSAFKHDATLYSVCLDPVSGRVFAGSEDFGIHVFDPAAEKKEAVAAWTRHDSYVSALACVKRGEKSVLISGSYDRKLIWWDTGKSEPSRTVEAHQGWVRDLVPLPDGSRLVSAGDDMLVKLWETDTGKLVRTFAGHATRTPQGHVTALYVVAVSPDGKYLAGGDRVGEVRVWETETGKQVQSFQVPVLYTYDPMQRKRSIGGIRSLAFSLDGNSLAVGGIGQIGNVDGLAGPIHIEVWDWKKPEQRFSAGAGGQRGMVNHLLFHPAGWLIGSGGGGEGFLAFWKIDPMPAGPNQKDPITAQRTKVDGHVHDLCLNAAGTELWAAGFKKLEAWGLGN